MLRMLNSCQFTKWPKKIVDIIFGTLTSQPMMITHWLICCHLLSTVSLWHHGRCESCDQWALNTVTSWQWHGEPVTSQYQAWAMRSDSSLVALHCTLWLVCLSGGVVTQIGGNHVTNINVNDWSFSHYVIINLQRCYRWAVVSTLRQANGHHTVWKLVCYDGTAA